MTALRSSLQRLTAAIGMLETSVEQLEKSRVGQQHDMFGNVIAGASNQNPGTASTPENKKMIAERLDVAIDKVEKLLAQDA